MTRGPLDFDQDMVKITKFSLQSVSAPEVAFIMLHLPRELFSRSYLIGIASWSFSKSWLIVVHSCSFEYTMSYSHELHCSALFLILFFVSWFCSILNVPYDCSAEADLLYSLIVKAKFENNRYQKPKKQPNISTQHVDWFWYLYRNISKSPQHCWIDIEEPGIDFYE